MQIIGIDDPVVCEKIQRTILGIEGVVSITFDKVNKSVIVNVREVKGESRKEMIHTSLR